MLWAANPWDPKFFAEMEAKYFKWTGPTKKVWVAPVLPPTKADPFATIFDDLLTREQSPPLR